MKEIGHIQAFDTVRFNHDLCEVKNIVPLLDEGYVNWALYSVFYQIALSPNQTKNGAFSMTQWGAGIYKGWDIVDYAAIALIESAPLMLTPGRRCENGRPVPVQDADWIKFTLALADTGRAAYKASQTRNQETVSDFTEQLAETCLACHRVYRDNRGRNADQSSRCIK